MPGTHRRLAHLLLLSICFVNALAQEKRDASTSGQAMAITASAADGRIRFTAPGSAVKLRLEVISESGESLFDATSRGNVLDWTLSDGAGVPLADGLYLCVVTVKYLSGQLSQRIASADVRGGQAGLRALMQSQLTAGQMQTVGPVEEGAALKIIERGEVKEFTAIAHDGADGQITRGKGALTFRLGDLYSGADSEQMRLTEEGNLGIGTDDPQARLDVAGAIRARGGIQFFDGSTLNFSAKGGLRVRLPSGKEVSVNPSINVSGTGTQNRVAKWVDNAGALGDSNIFEDLSGNIGVGTTTPNANAVAHFNKSQNTGSALFVTNNNSGSSAIASIRVGLNPSDYGSSYASLNILGLNWQPGLGGSFLKGRTGIIESNGSNFAIGNYNNTEPIIFYTTSGRVERMRLTADGSLGIGTTPGAQLHVRARNGSTNGLIVQTFSAPAADAINVRNLAGATLWGVEANGDDFAPLRRSHSLTRTLPAAVDSYVEIGMFQVLTSSLHVSVSFQGAFSVARQYLIPTFVDFSGAGWQTVLPLASTGTYNGNDFALDAKLENYTVYLRLRRTAGSTLETANIVLRQEGNSSDGFVSTTAIGIGVVPNSFYSGAVLTQVNGNVGIALANPQRRLHVQTNATGGDGRTVALFENAGNNTSSSISTGITITDGAVTTTLSSFGQAYSVLPGFAGYSVLSGERSGVILRAGDASGTIRFLTNNTSERMRISPDGNVGIGEVAPARKLHIGDAMRLQPLAIPPANPASGDLYFDSSEALCVYVNGAWAKIAGAGACD